MAWIHYIKSRTLRSSTDIQGDVMVAIDRSIYIIGYEETERELHNYIIGYETIERELQVHIFNVENSTWNIVRFGDDSDFTPWEMVKYFAVAYDGNILVYAQNYSRESSLFVFNTQTLRWNRLSPGGAISWNEVWWGGCLLHGELYILKGSGQLKLWALDMEIMSWRLVSETNFDYAWYPVRILACENRIYTLINSTRYGHSITRVVYYDTASEIWGWLDGPGLMRHTHPGWSFVYSNHFYCMFKIPNEPEVALRYCLERNEWERTRFEGVSPSPGYIRGNIVVLSSKAYFFDFFYHVLQVLDFNPSLKTRCLAAISKYGLNTSDLPESLQRELSMYKRRA